MVFREVDLPRSWLWCLVLLLVGTIRASAQQDICLPPTDSHEAHTFAILSVPVAFTGSRAPAPAHGVSIGIEAATLPSVDSITATPTTCRPDKGRPENTRPLPGLIRPRIRIGVAGLVFEGSWIPPVAVNGVKANLFGLAVGRPIALSPRWMLGLRAEATFGTLRGPFTCDDKAVRDANNPVCYQGQVSSDSWKPGIFGAEAVIGGTSSRWRPHVGLGYSVLRPRFQVDFTDRQGETDRRQVNVDLNRVAVFGGITWIAGASSVTGEIYSTPADAVTARVVYRMVVSR